jgi:predicted TIM-barrel fold metal-dependent hydrolase
MFTPAVDTHAHVFDRSCRLVEPRRYTPGYEAPAERYIEVLDRAGVAFGVLVQPSFLGTDNAYLMAGLARWPDRLRGVAVVAPDIADAALEAMAAAGVRGIRYNLLSLDPAAVATPAYRALTRRVTALGWLVEVHAHGADLPAVLDTLLTDGATVVVDHFGRPGAAEPEAEPQADPGLRRLLASAPTGLVWVKLSAPYRQVGRDMTGHAAVLLTHFGPERLLWGSDWPWTQHEAQTSYAECVEQIAGWLGPVADIRARFNRASRALYGFPAQD